jgi:TonB family protein
MFYAFLALATAATLPKATPIDPASWFSPDDYPAEAQKKGIEGQVTFDVEVDAEGRPDSCRIARSSRSPLLDKATCDIVLAKAKFKPALSRGKPVPGHYSTTTYWRLEGQGAATSGYFETIIDFSKDPEHPTCTTLSSGMSTGPSCTQALQKYGADGAKNKLTKLVLLMSIATGDEQPYRGDPAWGSRLAFVAFDLYPPAPGGKPACAVIAKEGAPPDLNPCGSYTDASTLSEKDKANPERAHIEQSMFGLAQRANGSGKCNEGQSAGEVRGCV